jgi:hypothetical protein
MANTPFRRPPKIGRNDPCFCGSGRKFKHCHGGPQHTLPALLLETEIIEQGRRNFEKHRVAEIQRQKQQGVGRRIISTVFKGYRFVAVGSQLHYGKFESFFDFLGDYIKRLFGPDWGNTEIAKPLADRHTLMHWYDKLCHLQAAHAKGPGQIFSMPMTGAVAAYNRLAYNLYLIAHNGQNIQSRLLSRLKNNDNFQGAFFETQVAAWLIKAGFELEFEDESDRRETHCEFTATYVPTGDKYSVEAKSRETESGNASRPKVGRKLFEALQKKAKHKRLVFLDLNKPLHTREAANLAFDRAERIIRQSEGLEIEEEPAPSAYVCITNMNDQYLLDTSALTTMISFKGYKLRDFMGNEYGSLREAARARERHWPMFRLLKSMEEHRDIPQTFDGELPSEVFASNSQPRLRVGRRYAVAAPDGANVDAELMQAAVSGDKAFCILRDPTNSNSWMGTFEMSPDELADYARHPDTYFGVYQREHKQLETAMEMFDFFVGGYENTPKERLIEIFRGIIGNDDVGRMSQKDLVELIAERLTMDQIAKGFAVKPTRRR